MSLAWWNGRMVPLEEVRLSPADAGFLFGDGLFETLRVDAGRPRDLSAHLDRLFAGLQRLSIAPPEDRCALGRAAPPRGRTGRSSASCWRAPRTAPS